MIYLKIIDISRTVQNAPVYPGTSKTEIKRISDMQKGANNNFSLISTNTHAGTHIDAFCHFVKDAKTVDQMDLSLYYGLCRVLSFPENSILTKKDFEEKLSGIQRIAIHGGGYTYLDASAARFLIDSGIQTIVTDALSVAPLDNEQEIHSILLSAGIAIVENAILEHVSEGDYQLIAFPIKYGGADGAPVRAVLIGE